MTELRAGALSATLADAVLRDVRVAGRPALAALYVTVRDAGWRTAPAEILAERTVPTPGGSRTELDVRHRLDDVDFRWHGVVDISAGGLSFTMDGVAVSGFDANRIGFCLLHPQAVRGRALRAGGPGGEHTGAFPEQVSPHQVLLGLDRMAYDVGGGAELAIRMSGDLFEIEDHRNWSDPGWKTYCTPLSAPRPVRRSAGDRVRQTVELRAVGAVDAGAESDGPGGDAGRVRLAVGGATVATVPKLGLGARCAPSSAAVRTAVRALSPAYLHVELEDGTPWQERAAAARAEASGLGVPLEVALVATAARVSGMARELAALDVAPARVSVYSPSRHVTEPGTTAAVAAALGGTGEAVPVGGGSRAHLAELNRGDFGTGLGTGSRGMGDSHDDSGRDAGRAGVWRHVTYGLTPQVHHTDDASILATAPAVGDGFARALGIARGLPVVVGPVTLRPRFNADLAGGDRLPAADAPGPDIDPRQYDALAGVYLAAVVARLTGATAVTAFRTAGPRGVVTDAGTPTPAARVVAAVTALAGSGLLAVAVTGGEETVSALAAETPSGGRLLVANTGARAVRLELVGVRARDARLIVAAGGGAGGAATEGARAGEGDSLDPDRIVLPPLSVVLIGTAPS